jgi:hypothetical protein
MRKMGVTQGALQVHDNTQLTTKYWQPPKEGSSELEYKDVKTLQRT